MQRGYRISYKYEGMLTDSFEIFYVVTKFIRPTMDDIKLSVINYEKKCKYLSDLDDNDNEQIKTNIKDLITYCAELRPYIAFNKIQINVHNKTAHYILKNEVDLILTNFPEGRESKIGIFSTIISGFFKLSFKGISSFLHKRRHKALHKAVHAMSAKADIQRNKLMHLEDTLVMYGVYNAETSERLIKTVHTLHSRQPMNESLFTGQVTKAYEYYSQMNWKSWYTTLCHKLNALFENNKRQIY